MAAWWDSIDITVEVAFSTDPLATPTWTDVTDYVRDIPSLFVGKTSEDSSVGPASGTIVFGNTDRRFDPDYASSPYAPNVKPMRRIRISVERGAFSAVLFTGFVTSWRNDWTVDGDGISVASLTDTVWWANAEPLSPSAYATAVLDLAPILYWPMQDPGLVEDLGFYNVTGAETANPALGRASTVDLAAPIGAPVAFVSTDPASTGAVQANIPADKAFEPKTIAVWVQGSDPVSVSYNEGTESGLTVYLDPAGIRVEYSHQTDDRSYTTFGGLAVGATFTTSEPHHIVVTCDGTNIVTYIDGHVVSTNALTVGATAVSGSTFRANAVFAEDMAVSHFAVWDDTLAAADIFEMFLAGQNAYGHPTGETSGVRIGRVLDEIGFPAGLRALDTGVTIQGPYLPQSQNGIDYIRQVVESERGLLFVDRSGALTFYDRVTMTDGSLDTGYVLSDDGAAGSIHYERLVTDGATVDTIRNIVTVSYAQTGAITRRDATSVEEYGAQRLNVDGNTMLYARDASNIAGFELDQRKDPSTRVVSAECVIRQASATQTQTQVEKLLDLWVGDIVDVEITPRSISPQVVKTVQVLGIRYAISKEQFFVTLYLSPAYAQTGWFTLGVSALGGADILLG